MRGGFSEESLSNVLEFSTEASIEDQRKEIGYDSISVHGIIKVSPKLFKKLISNRISAFEKKYFKN
jgi:hypothetical protein